MVLSMYSRNIARPTPAESASIKPMTIDRMRAGLIGVFGTRAGLILTLTVGMCILSGFLALRRVRTADPAEVFG